jgi:hypothetical protein
MMHVADDPDDRVPRALNAADLHALTHGILIRPYALGGALANHHDALDALPIGVGDEAPAPQRDPHRREVVGRHRVPFDGGIARPPGAVFDVESPPVVVAAKWNLAGRGDRLDARQRAETREEQVRC